MTPRYPLPTAHKQTIFNFLDTFNFTKQHYEQGYRYWAKGGRGWDRTFATGGTYTMKALMWYQHIHKPKSKEYRARIIMNALCHAATPVMENLT